VFLKHNKIYILLELTKSSHFPIVKQLFFPKNFLKNGVKKIQEKTAMPKKFWTFLPFLKATLIFQSATFGIVFLMPHYNRAKTGLCQGLSTYPGGI
jgi:hypothetical protein